MKHSMIVGFGALATLFVVPAFSSTSVLAQFQKTREVVAQNSQRQPQVQLQLAAEQKVMLADAQGKPQVTWQTLSGQKIQVHPGDEIRYTLNGENTSTRPVKNLIVTQPIPKQLVYVLNSASVGTNKGAEITYSIDGGKSFVQTPRVEVKKANGTLEKQPAPAEVYTHIRWNFGDAVASNAILNATYNVKVR
jgi:uncharacterized repeat protein (TIGR01451 family)